MEHLSVQATLRGKQSGGELTRSRKSGQVPVSVSGKGIAPVSLFVSAVDINRILTAKTGKNTLIDITYDGGRHVARLANVDRDAIKTTILAVSLQTITTGEPLKATIGLNIVGVPAAVRDQSGMLSTSLTHLEVRALPEQMIASLTVDASKLGVGDSIHARDIALPAGFELLTDPNALIVGVHAAEDIAADLAAEEAAAIDAAPAIEAAEDP